MLQLLLQEHMCIWEAAASVLRLQCHYQEWNECSSKCSLPQHSNFAKADLQDSIEFRLNLIFQMKPRYSSLVKQTWIPNYLCFLTFVWPNPAKFLRTTTTTAQPWSHFVLQLLVVAYYKSWCWLLQYCCSTILEHETRNYLDMHASGKWWFELEPRELQAYIP